MALFDISPSLFKLKEVPYLTSQNKYSNWKFTSYIHPKAFLWNKLLENLLL